VLTGVRFHLGAIQSDPAQLHQIHFPRQQQNLDKQSLNLRKEAAAEGGNRVMIRMRVGRQITERNRVVGGAFNLAAGEDAGRVSINQQAEQYARMMGPRTAPGILPGELRQIELINHFNDEPGQVFLRQPILNGRGKQEVSVPISKYKMSHH